MSFSYVYILQSKLEPHRFYVGLTQDLKARLRKHNAGEVPHSSKFRPWRIKAAVAFSESQLAVAFKRYLQNCLWPSLCKENVFEPPDASPQYLTSDLKCCSSNPSQRYLKFEPQMNTDKHRCKI